jgi:hypothetical protein
LVLAVTAAGQTPAAGCAEGYRVVAVRWDAVLKTGWELRQDCLHPEWPARLAAASEADRKLVLAAITGAAAGNGEGGAGQRAQRPAVLAGDRVRLWRQDERVRIETTGFAEQTAASGERVVVRTTFLAEDGIAVVQRIAGVVRGPGEVEIER